MKKSFFISLLFITTIALWSCKKDNYVPDAVSVKLSATTFYKNSSEETKYERSGAIEKTSYAQPVNDAGSNRFLVNLGAFGDAPNLSGFGIRFLFNQQTNPEGINGTYNFPQDQLLIRTDFRNEVTQTITENIF